MSLASAEQFVGRMKEDKEFRNKVQALPDDKALKDYLLSQGFDFDQRALIGAMAACMAEMDSMMSGMKAG